MKTKAIYFEHALDRMTTRLKSKLLLTIFSLCILSAHAEKPTISDPWQIIKTNWRNSMFGPPLDGSSPSNCIQFLPNDYNLILDVFVAVADPSVSNYPDLYIQVEINTPSGVPLPTPSSFLIGPLAESELDAIDTGCTTLFQQAFTISTSFAENCPSGSGTWLTTVRAKIVKYNSSGELIPYSAVNYPDLFPEEYTEAYDSNGNDIVFIERKHSCCPPSNSMTSDHDEVYLFNSEDGTLNSRNAQPINDLNNIKNNHIIDLFPNPFEDGFFIDYSHSKEENLHLEIFNTKGEIIKVIDPNEHTVRGYIDLKDLPSGIYYGVITGEEKRQVIKLFKQ